MKADEIRAALSPPPEFDGDNVVLPAFIWATLVGAANDWLAWDAVFESIWVDVDPRPDESDIGMQLGAEGMARVTSNTADEWKERFNRELLRLASTGAPFTAEDVIDVVGLPHPVGHKGNNVIGALISAASRRRIIQFHGMEVPRRATSHGRRIQVWVGGVRE